MGPLRAIWPQSPGALPGLLSSSRKGRLGPGNIGRPCLRAFNFAVASAYMHFPRVVPLLTAVSPSGINLNIIFWKRSCRANYNIKASFYIHPLPVTISYCISPLAFIYYVFTFLTKCFPCWNVSFPGQTLFVSFIHGSAPMPTTVSGTG